MVRALIIKVIDKGKVVKKVEIDTDLLELVLKRKKDLGTDWFGRILASIFSGDPLQVSITDESGATRTGYLRAGIHTAELPQCNSDFFVGSAVSKYPLYPWIAVGTGTTAPTRSDTTIELELDRKPANTNYTDGSGVVVISAAFVFTADQNISEIGLLLCTSAGSCGSPGACVLVDRTVLSTPVTVAAGQTLYVEYRISI